MRQISTILMILLVVSLTSCFEKKQDLAEEDIAEIVVEAPDNSSQGEDPSQESLEEEKEIDETNTNDTPVEEETLENSNGDVSGQIDDEDAQIASEVSAEIEAQENEDIDEYKDQITDKEAELEELMQDIFGNFDS